MGKNLLNSDSKGETVKVYTTIEMVERFKVDDFFPRREDQYSKVPTKIVNKLIRDNWDEFFPDGPSRNVISSICYNGFNVLQWVDIGGDKYDRDYLRGQLQDAILYGTIKSLRVSML